jgi:hypothetical protein
LLRSDAAKACFRAAVCSADKKLNCYTLPLLPCLIFLALVVSTNPSSSFFLFRKCNIFSCNWSLVYLVFIFYVYKSEFSIFLKRYLYLYNFIFELLEFS